MKSPLAQVKEAFGDKKKLVEAVEKFTGEDLWLGRTNKDKGLAHVSNAKLLKLHATFSQVKERFGTRFKLVDAILALENRAKDEGFRTRLLAYPVPRLWDTYKSAHKRKAQAPIPKKGEAGTSSKAATAKTKAATPPASPENDAKAPKKKAAPAA